MQLFTFADEVGPGLPLWMPKGTVIQTELRNWAEETEKKWGYVRVRTPHIAKHTLYEISGHLPYYKDDMYSPMDIDGEEYYLKGMNCPHHHMIFKATPKSYRDLPLRYAEYGEVYRYEQSGTLFGLMRVRFIQQNDAHIYCTEDQAEKEFLDVLKLHEYYYNTLGLTKKDYHIVIGLPDEKKRDKYHGDKALWDKAEKMMRNAIDKSAIKHIDDVGGAAFYGPKVDFNITSSVGREFGISTNQLDLYMPTRFNLEYTDAKGNKQLAVVIHRAPLGSHERFIGFLIEHYGGNFPTWLSPVQVKVLPISTRHMDYANKISNTLRENDIRAELDDRNATLPGKIRDAQNEKVNYMLIVGDREMKTNTVMQRARSGESDGPFSLDIFIKNIKNEIGDKAIWKSDQKSF
ncbi:threonine--tRNA ligase [Candidatus Woesebacteria bacterium RIFCSPHIGHO2_12_FULL_38_9]|nr:MAG: threonine--tRNA ligase [Candidatus Woesebacteria bacterium RIFCSPHIGHO2_12_FULL_38_9]